MPEMTDRQAAAWPGAVDEAQRYVESSTIPLDLSDHYWRVRWDDESRPGRGHMMWATWSDGEYFVEVSMDVYGYPRVAVAELMWEHNGNDEECTCEPCIGERAESEGQCPKCGVTVTDQTPSAFYVSHDERCGGELNEPEGR